MSKAEYLLRVDFDGAGTYGGTSDDISVFTQNVTWRRGRDYASQLTGRSVAGRLVAVLNNNGGTFSPFNTDSPLSGSLLPGRLVEFSGTTGGTSYVQWTGYLQRIIPQPSVKGLNVAILEATGPLGFVNRKDVAMAMVTDVETGTAIGTLLGKAGWTGGTLLDDGQTTMNRFWVDKQKVISALRLPEETEAGFIVETKTGTIAFEDRHHRLKSPHTASQATFTDSGTGTLVFMGIAQEDPLPNIFNILEATVQLYTLGTSSTLWALSELGTTTKIERNGGTRTWWAEYPNPDSAGDAFGVDSWDTISTIGPLLEANSDPSGTGGADLSGDIGVAQEGFGNSQKITLTNNNPTQDAYLNLLEAPGTAIFASDPVRVTAEDAPSQTAFGESTFPNPAQFLPDTQEAQDWADYHLSIYKDPIPIIPITIVANRDDANLEPVFIRDISDRITIIGTGDAGLGVAEDFYIESEMHRVGRDRMHVVTYECSQAAKFSEFWVLDSSALGTSTRLAY